MPTTNIGLHSTNEELLEDLHKRFPGVKSILKSLNIQAGTWGKEIITNCIKITQLSSGCGCMLFSGYLFLGYNKDFIPLIKYIFNLYKLNGTCGTFITTSGGTLEPFLLELGFKEVSKYPNVKHGSSSTQKLFILTL